MRVARDHVREPGVDERAPASGGGATEPAVQRGGRYLHETTGMHERAEPLGVLSHLMIPLRVCEHRNDALCPQREQPLLYPERPSDIRKLDEQIPRVPTQPEP